MARLEHLLLPQGLLLWATVYSVSSPSQCGEDEFQSDTFCCQLCPAGTYVLKPCQGDHGKSECVPCEAGYFMKYNNHELNCFPCSQCRDDQEEVAECSQTADRECRCKQGTYCNSENCVEKCLPCSRCPNGRVIRHCNATMDTLCDTLDSGSGMPSCRCLCLSGAEKAVIITAAVMVIIAAVIKIIDLFITTRFYKRGRLRLPHASEEVIQLSSNTLQSSNE
ncbi:tumor necrosis factor receptor superfamily member 26-like isoform X2 [Alexandromys fortis]|uniref:tumor necrosis factor receptor superfamily member 26-like isoform X2 n=1 Tax=Alexandromys fortis TaxID=100897 RepID=UPI0021522EE7|nr:tumor necrosis factor receptor superfamily member 26-like isoform X2 [Microtus fortis]